VSRSGWLFMVVEHNSFGPGTSDNFLSEVSSGVQLDRNVLGIDKEIHSKALHVQV
jgi:hypothetical protein